MRTTIGELANDLIEYSNSVQMSNSNEIPFIRAFLGGSSGFTRGYVYIVQVDEHRYSVCDNYDDLNGNRFFPSRNKSNPFIIEKDIIRMKFGGSSTETFGDEYESVVHNLSPSEFQDHLYTLLSKYMIIKFDMNTLNARLTSEFKNPKIKRILEATFNEKKHHNGTFKDFIDIVIKNRESFSLGNLRSREKQEVCSRLQNIGIVVSLDKNMITEAKFEKRK